MIEKSSPINVKDINTKISRFKLVITRDFKQGTIQENEYKAIMYELDSDNTNDYKYGIYTMYLIMLMGRVD